MSTLDGTWVYVETIGKTHIGKVVGIRSAGKTTIPTTNDEILDAEKIILCPTYDYVTLLGRDPSYYADPALMKLDRNFMIATVCSTVEHVCMYITATNIVFFSDIPIALKTVIENVIDTAITSAITDGSNVFFTKVC